MLLETSVTPPDALAADKTAGTGMDDVVAGRISRDLEDNLSSIPPSTLLLVAVVAAVLLLLLLLPLMPLLSGAAAETDRKVCGCIWLED